jgi:Dual specificity phosphatase, catalytic domain
MTDAVTAVFIPAKKRPCKPLNIPPRQEFLPSEPPQPPSPSVVLRRGDESGWLFLGNEDDAINQAFVDSNKITRFIHVCRECKCTFDPDDPAHLRISINDSHREPIRDHFENAILFFDKVRAEDANVLVHCFAGISRSPTIVLAYLMNNGYRFKDALTFLKTQRECVDPNLHFLGSLVSYEKQLLDQ